MSGTLIFLPHSYSLTVSMCLNWQAGDVHFCRCQRSGYTHHPSVQSPSEHQVRICALSLLCASSFPSRTASASLSGWPASTVLATMPCSALHSLCAVACHRALGERSATAWIWAYNYQYLLRFGFVRWLRCLNLSSHAAHCWPGHRH